MIRQKIKKKKVNKILYFSIKVGKKPTTKLKYCISIKFFLAQILLNKNKNKQKNALIQIKNMNYLAKLNNHNIREDEEKKWFMI